MALFPVRSPRVSPLGICCCHAVQRDVYLYIPLMILLNHQCISILNVWRDVLVAAGLGSSVRRILNILSYFIQLFSSVDPHYHSALHLRVTETAGLPFTF